MATFDFDHAPERLGTRCVKWDSIGEGELPMWVADMDFEVAPAIRQAVERRCADERAAVLLFCNPHNPAGRVWRRDELERVSDICRRHHVRVIADEIHCELVMPGYEYTPFASLSDETSAITVTLNSPSKSFNTAGLMQSNVICSDTEMRRRVDRVINIFEVCEVNPFGPDALVAAYNESEEWLDELNRYLYDNYLELKRFFAEYMPKIEVLKLEGTYLVWVDISGLEFTSDELEAKLRDEGKVYLNSGTMYGRRAGQGYMRINIACPRSRMIDGLTRMAKVLAPYMEDDCDMGCPA